MVVVYMMYGAVNEVVMVMMMVEVVEWQWL